MKTVTSVRISECEKKALLKKTKKKNLSNAVVSALNHIIKTYQNEQVFYAIKSSSKKKWIWIDAKFFLLIEKYSNVNDVTIEQVIYTAVKEVLLLEQPIMDKAGI